jgi:ArsR family transcriptional regulator
MVLERLAGDDEATLFDASIRAIAHPLRRQILIWLKTPQLYFPEQKYGRELGVCVGQISMRCSLSKSTVSVHLNALRTAGLVELHKVGSVHFYKRNEDAIHSFGTDIKLLMQGDAC